MDIYSGPKPNVIKGTKGIVKVQPSVRLSMDEEQQFWFANVLDLSDLTVTLEV